MHVCEVASSLCEAWLACMQKNKCGWDEKKKKWKSDEQTVQGWGYLSCSPPALSANWATHCPDPDPLPIHRVPFSRPWRTAGSSLWVPRPPSAGQWGSTPRCPPSWHPPPLLTMDPSGPGVPHNGRTRVTEVVTWPLKMQHQVWPGRAALIRPFGTRRPEVRIDPM